jgi:hypothetical protein
MIANPRVGMLAQVWYNKRVAPSRPLHGKVGRVVVASRGKPRNHGLRMPDGTFHVVPCGNLRPAPCPVTS